MLDDRAATLIQARFRGRQWRRRWRACIRGVTRLQARQRARYTRREFAVLRQLHRDQAELERATARRQRRILQSEQELAFLRHTSPGDLARLRELQQRRGARLIQQRWRLARGGSRAQRGDQEVADPRDRVFAFDPFAFDGSEDGGAPATGEMEPPLALLGPLPETAEGVGAATDGEAFAARRKVIHERVKKKVKELKDRDVRNSVLSAKVSPVSGKPTRRELCETMGQLRRQSSGRIAQHVATYRAEQSSRLHTRAQLVASCSNRLTHLKAEQPPSLSDNQGPRHSSAVFESMERWDDARKRAAWRQHRAVVGHALKKQHWWQTQLAGDERDIRSTYARSPWEPGRPIWTWPPRPEADSSSSNGREPAGADEMSAFLFGEAGDAPVPDDEASAWWRAHCTQSHLCFMADENSSESGNTADKADTLDKPSRWTPEAVVNPLLWRVMDQAKRHQRAKDIARELLLRADHFDELVARGVAEVEAKMLVNTQLKEELATRAQRRQERKTREQQAAVTIQRHARGLQGRRRAREVRAEFFVMVRGRAIRKGKCEECGEQRAVLECRECQDSAHFCPVCWVHVHSTRRRKAHVALPITAPLPVPALKTKERELAGKNNAQATRAPAEIAPRPSGGAEASRRPDGVSIPRLALAAARSEPPGGADVRESRAAGRVLSGNDEVKRPVPLSDERVTGKQAMSTAIEQTSTPTEQQVDLQSKEDATSAVGSVLREHGTAISGADTDPSAAVTAGGASPGEANAVSIAADPPPASSAANVGEHTLVETAPASEGKSEDRRAPTEVQEATSDKKRPVVKPSVRPSLKERMKKAASAKASAVDVDVVVAAAAPQTSAAFPLPPAGDAPAPTAPDGVAHGEAEAGGKSATSPHDVEEKARSAGGDGHRASDSTPVATDAGTSAQAEDSGVSNSPSPGEEAALQLQGEQKEEAGEV